MPLPRRRALDTPDGNDTSVYEITLGSIKSPLVMVFVGCVLGSAFLAFVISTCYRYYKRRRDGVRQKPCEDLKGDDSNMQRYLAWKKTPPRSLLHCKDGLNTGHMPSEWDVAICAICLDVVRDYDTIYKLKCSHVFHFGCAKAWYDREAGRTCPICRRTRLSVDDNTPMSLEQPAGT
ncbi:hypothetical protein WAI453_004306 [Rhynchosporium graminicola]